MLWLIIYEKIFTTLVVKKTHNRIPKTFKNCFPRGQSKIPPEYMQKKYVPVVWMYRNRQLWCNYSFNFVEYASSRFLQGRFTLPLLFERSEFLIATCEKKKLTVCVCVCSANRQNTVYLCLSTYIVFENTHAHRNCGQHTHIYQVHHTCTGILCTSSMYDTITYVQL